ncbi:hypothetical protein [Amycolatopsis sp. CA-230715]|uniref:hypothetical protein n=1 Tax=Amycolatopsis sp. CA-230715 TaxID=2745196 RepID=UPI001C0370CE|nr:hypothetical protein [Amycolatopsis sp. CA-230715]QWF85908.1 hypothetical protein HUW46_09388 [Amycolatopsis sp. CA-230715]
MRKSEAVCDVDGRPLVRRTLVKRATGGRPIGRVGRTLRQLKRVEVVFISYTRPEDSLVRHMVGTELRVVDRD